ncbi:hypothetical protein OAC51_09830 [Flavobacteriaceae bacterium]|nr:hypothetical protein [Flavobacteriaceae bacterium]
MPKKLLLITKKQEALLSFIPNTLKEFALAKVLDQNVDTLPSGFKKTISEYLTIKHDNTLVKSLAYISAIIDLDGLLVLPYNPRNEISDDGNQYYISDEILTEAGDIINENISNENISGDITDLNQIFLTIAPLRFTSSVEDLFYKNETPIGNEIATGKDVFYFESYAKYYNIKSAVLKGIKAFSNNHQVKEYIDQNWNFDSISDHRNDSAYFWKNELILGLEKSFFRQLTPADYYPKPDTFIKYLKYFKKAYSVYREDYTKIDNYLRDEDEKGLLDFLKTRLDMFQLLIAEEYEILNIITENIIKKTLDEKLSDIIYFLPEEKRAAFFDQKKPHVTLNRSISSILDDESNAFLVSCVVDQTRFSELPTLRYNLLENLLEGFDREDRMSIFRDFKNIESQKPTSAFKQKKLNVLISPIHFEEHLSYLSLEEKIDYFKNIDKGVDTYWKLLAESNAVSVNALFSMDENKIKPILEGLNKDSKEYYLNYSLKKLIEKGLIEKNTEKVIEQIDIRYRYDNLYGLDTVERSISEFLNYEALNFFDENLILEIKDHIKTNKQDGKYSMHKPASSSEEMTNTTEDEASITRATAQEQLGSSTPKSSTSKPPDVSQEAISQTSKLEPVAKPSTSQATDLSVKQTEATLSSEATKYSPQKEAAPKRAKEQVGSFKASLQHGLASREQLSSSEQREEEEQEQSEEKNMNGLLSAINSRQDSKVKNDKLKQPDVSNPMNELGIGFGKGNR